MKQFIDQPVKMRDGISLSTDIRMPENGESFPVILVRTPYSNSQLEDKLFNYIISGFAVVTQDCRGRFDSEGKFNPLHEPEDGYDTIEWLTEQSWCNGNVAMSGGSYCGCVQFAAAVEKPPALKAISPIVFGGNPYNNTAYENGIFRLSEAIIWSTKVSGKSNQSNATTDWKNIIKHLPLSELDKKAGYKIDYLHDWLRHEYYDNYWQNINFDEKLTSCDIPVLLITGWYDAFYKASLKSFELISKYRKDNNLSVKTKLIVGPWTHAVSAYATGDIFFGENADRNLNQIEYSWNNFFLNNVNSEIIDSPPVYIFTMGSNTWRYENEWPPVNSKNKVFYLSSSGNAAADLNDGLLSEKNSSSAEKDTFTYNPLNPVITVGGNVIDDTLCLNGPRVQNDVENRNDVVIYTSTPLEKDLEVTGNIKLVLYISTDVVDTDFFARLCDVYPDGKSFNICTGGNRLKFRKGFDREVLYEKGSVEKIEIAVGATSNLFKKNHRIRLQISSSCFPEYARNLNTGENIYSAKKTFTANQIVYHSERYQSKMILPVIP